MKHKFLSLVAATCMVGFMAISASAGGLQPMSDGSLSSISAKGMVSNYSYVSLSGSQNSASGIIIADLSSSAVNNQANYATYTKHFLLQLNKGKAINKVKSEDGSVAQASSVSLNNSENFASGLMIVNASSSAANNQLNIAWNSASLVQLNFGKAINIVSGESCGEGCNNKSTVSATSGVALVNSESNTNGLMIANMSSSAANNQLNVNYNTTGCFTPQINNGLAVNVIAGH